MCINSPEKRRLTSLFLTKSPKEKGLLFLEVWQCAVGSDQIRVKIVCFCSAYNCLWQIGVVIHELSHVLGLWHEHQRPSRDEHIHVRCRWCISSCFEAQTNFTSCFLLLECFLLGLVLVFLGDLREYETRKGKQLWQSFRATSFGPVPLRLLQRYPLRFKGIGNSPPRLRRKKNNQHLQEQVFLVSKRANLSWKLHWMNIRWAPHCFGQTIFLWGSPLELICIHSIIHRTMVEQCGMVTTPSSWTSCGPMMTSTSEAWGSAYIFPS